jgi:transcriptional regulator with XRE-family HTH domain
MIALPRLRAVRTLKAMSQHDLARASGVSPDTIYRLETEQREAQPRTTRKLAAALGVDPAELMKGE